MTSIIKFTPLSGALNEGPNCYMLQVSVSSFALHFCCLICCVRQLPAQYKYHTVILLHAKTIVTCVRIF